MNSSHKICTILFTYQLISCSQQPQEEGTIIVPFLQMRELCGYVFCQHHTALSPGFLSSVPRCVAYYKQLSSLTFFISTAWNLPLPPPTPHGVLPVILNCWVFFFLPPPSLSPERHSLHHLPHSSEVPSFSPFHVFNWPQVASLQLLKHVWAMQGFRFPFHSQLSCASLRDPCWRSSPFWQKALALLEMPYLKSR